MLKGRYELQEKHGEGGMAEIYRAHQTNLGRDVAIKFIKDIIDTPEFRARFQREARAAAQRRQAIAQDRDLSNVITLANLGNAEMGTESRLPLGLLFMGS